MRKDNFKDVFVDVGGRKIHAVGAGNGEDVVFLHGWGADASAFLFAANRLAAGHRVTLIDFAGFGMSDPPATAYGVDDYARETVKTLEALGVKEGIFVGHSFGGRVALEIAAKYGDMAKKLALVDSAGLKPRRGARYYLRIWLHKALKKLGFKGLKGSEDFRKLSPLMKETFKKVVNYDQTPLLGNIFIPTAIFWGKADRVTPMYMARKFSRRIADSALFTLEGGHFAYAEDSGKFLAVLEAFIDG